MASACALTSPYDQRSNAPFMAVRSLSRNSGLMSDVNVTAPVGVSVMVVPLSSARHSVTVASARPRHHWHDINLRTSLIVLVASQDGMDVRQLEYVVAIAEEGSFTRAAQRCHIVQSALSHQVARLESELGVKLFERTSRSVRLADAGLLILPYARQVLGDMAEARNAVDALSGITRGRLRIGMTQTAGRALDLIALIGDFHRQYPEIELSTLSGPGGELIEAVHDGQLDVAVAAMRPQGVPDGIVFHMTIESEPLVAVVAAAHRLAARKRVNLQDLASAGPFVEFLTGTTLRDQVDAAFAAVGARRESSFEVGQIADMVRYAASGLGTAIVPRVFTGPEGDRGYPTTAFRVLRIVAPGLELRIGAFRRKDRSPAAVGAFLALLPGNGRSRVHVQPSGV
jgi:DNA-binding transcriptional LysR family regulator